VDPSN